MLARVVRVEVKAVIIRKAAMTGAAAQALGADISSVHGD